jgi:beta-glucosidase-like glycosyl hydrolase
MPQHCRPSEDPFHSGAYGTAVVQGVQWSDALVGGAITVATTDNVAITTTDTNGAAAAADLARPKYTKINAALKHFFAYNIENGRGSTNFQISQHDIEDTYLPSFEAPIVQADAKGYMCSYSSVNGAPSCGSAFLSGTVRGFLTDIYTRACHWFPRMLA